MSPVRRCLLVIVCLAVGAAEAHAGMSRPAAVLTDVARTRIQNLSFFLAGFLLSSLLIQLLWNGLRRDFPVLPRLSYFKALGLVGLWGLLFVLVLTMVSGARELMTPSAGYRHRKPEQQPAEESPEEARRQQLTWLKDALWRYARANAGRFPPNRTDPGVPKERWRLPEPSGMQYVYLGGSVTPLDGVPLAFEPDVFGEGRWVLFTDGEVRRMTTEELARVLPAEAKP